MLTSDKLFKIPIKVYHGASVAKAERDIVNFMRSEEGDGEDELRKEPDWVVGYITLPIEEIISWVDHFSPQEEVVDVAKSGFTLTLIYTKTLGEFISVWDSKQFAAKRDAHILKIKDSV